MKYVVGLILGIVLGTATALALLYFNPLTQAQAPRGGESDWMLEYSLSASGTWLSTHDDSMALPVVPDDAPLLWETGIKGSLLQAMPLADATGRNAAVGTRVSVPSSATEFVRSGLLVEDYWLISVPGEGTVFVHALNNQWPLVRDTVVRVDWLQRDWSGPSEYAPTLGPGAAGARVVGLSGRFRGRQGGGRDTLRLDAYDGQLAQVSGKLVIELADAEL